MALDPQAKALLDQIAASGAVFAQTPEEFRLQLAQSASLAGLPEHVAHVKDIMIPVNEGEIPVRIYTPEGTGPFPVFVYFHGGGFIAGSIDVYDTPLRAVTNVSQAMVVSVGYRLAPEHKFPVAPEDCYAATKWVAEHIAGFNGDPSRLAIGGDSAGGNLAAVVALMSKERGGPKILHQILIYPVTNFTADTLSLRENGKGFYLEKDVIDFCYQNYLREEDKTSPYASPLLATDLSGLPPALVVTAEYDPLRDEGIQYAERLKEFGVQVEHHNYAGMIHGFFNMAGVMDQSKKLIEQVGVAIRTKAAAQRTKAAAQ